METRKKDMKKVCGSDIAGSPRGFESDDLRDAQDVVLAALLRGRTELLACPQIRAYSTGVPRWDIDSAETYKPEVTEFIIIGALPPAIRDAFLHEHGPAFILLDPRVKLARSGDWEHFVGTLKQ
ncbi:hypothetical protein NOV72_01362 [Caballeronia novacaledonica]|uniref:Uncharacterized protein n=1 Tax=Caballeronia novacaledonica TaxID=1544861 RepID=A0A2U3I1Y8_9BURK|nr:hypothetical protein [Caballeronia novacaledonica]SPB14113.1 hypothetical protein NOV72_01362 [Caballeronia novacaledonica]